MDGFSGSDHLGDQQRLRLHQLVERLHAVHRDKAESTTLDDLASLLPAGDEPLREEVLWRLIAEDLALRWEHGQPILLDAYATQFAELARPGAIPFELVYQEYLTRDRHGDAPQLEEYARRFPHQFRELEKCVAISQASQTIAPPADTKTTLRLSDQLTKVEGTADARQSDAASRQRTVGQGRYILHRLLGTGVFGEVWLGEAPGGIEVAIKIIRFPLGHHMTHQEKRALQVMKTMKHPFLIQVQSYWEEDDQLVIVMDLAERTLADRLQECLSQDGQGIPRHELGEYMQAAAEALDYLHSRDVIHRDIKPANLLLTENFAKVGDFGIARVLERHDASIRATVAGTPLYIAPEMFDGKPCPASDQYSLAVTYTELRTGEPPLSGESVLELMKAHATRKPKLAALTAQERPIVQRALAKKPTDRFPSCAAFVEALRQTHQPPPPLVPRRIAVASLILVGLAAIPAASVVYSWFTREGILVPEGCQPAPNAQLIKCYDVMNRRLYEEVLLIAGRVRIPLRLVPRNPNNEHDPPTFYMMKNKVSNELFEHVVGSLSPRDDCPLPVPKHADHPVFCVTALEAHEFAAKLQGQLPTPTQWDKAAGQFDGQAGLHGPYVQDWQPGDDAGIAIHRAAKGPLPIGAATKDRSPYQVNDMSGNGFEWTNEVYWNNENHRLSDMVSQLKAGDWASVTLRGKGYSATEPYQFDSEKEYPPQFNIRDAEVSFRIALPVLAQPQGPESAADEAR